MFTRSILFVFIILAGFLKSNAESIHKYCVKLDSTWVIDVFDAECHFNFVKKVYKGDIVYGIPPAEDDVYIKVVKINDEWLKYKRGNNSKYIPGELTVFFADDLGTCYPGANPYMDDQEFVLSSSLFEAVPKHKDKWPVYLALIFAIVLVVLDIKETSLLARLLVMLFLDCCIIYHYFGYMGGNTNWFVEDVGGLIRSTLAEGAFLLVALITIGNALALLHEVTEKGNFRTDFAIGIGGFVLLIPVYFVLWIFTSFPVRYTGYFLVATQIIQIGRLVLSCISNNGNILWLIPCVLIYPPAVLACFLISKGYINVWVMGQSMILNIANLWQQGLW